LIARACQIRQAAAAWHADPHALHDFVAGRQRVEVKSSIGPHRTHHFLLDQLLPLHGTYTIIASSVLEESITGTSIAGLGEQVLKRDELTADLRDRVSQILALSLGRDWRKARGVAFDTESAAARLRLYDAVTIPKVDPCLPVEVMDVQFRAELTEAIPMSSVELARQGGLFSALFR